MCQLRPGPRCTDDSCRDLAKARENYHGNLPVNPATASSYQPAPAIDRARRFSPETLHDHMMEESNRQEMERDRLNALKLAQKVQQEGYEPNELEATALRLEGDTIPSDPHELSEAISDSQHRLERYARDNDGLPRRGFRDAQDARDYAEQGFPDGEHPYDFDSFHDQQWRQYFASVDEEYTQAAFESHEPLQERAAQLRGELAQMEEEHEERMMNALQTGEDYNAADFARARAEKEDELEKLQARMAEGEVARAQMSTVASQLSNRSESQNFERDSTPGWENDPINSANLSQSIQEAEVDRDYWESERAEEMDALGINRSASAEDDPESAAYMRRYNQELDEHNGRIARLKAEEARRAGHERRQAIAQRRERERIRAAAATEELNRATPMIPDPAPKPVPEAFTVKHARGEATQAYMAELNHAVDNLKDDEDWTRYLNNVSQFHQYSTANQMLIGMQSPGAERVAGYQTWQKLGRQVKPGEKSIKILAPVTVSKDKLDDNGNVVMGEDGRPEKTQRTYFKPVSVFDVSQTEGEDYSFMSRSLSAEPPAGLKEDLESAIRSEGFELRYESGKNVERHGATSPDSKVVIVRGDMPPSATVTTLAHEYAHIKAGHLNKTGEYHTGRGGERGMMEMEAESISYVISRANGMQPQVNQSHSARYVWAWSKSATPEQTKQAAENIAKVCKNILGSGIFRNTAQHGGRVNANEGL